MSENRDNRMWPEYDPVDGLYALWGTVIVLLWFGVVVWLLTGGSQ